VSDKKNVMAKANIKQEIESEAGIYDLNRFLATLDVMGNPELEFGTDRFVIQNDNSKVEYTYAARNMLVLPPDKEITLGDTKATFFLPWSQLANVVKVAGVMDLPDIRFSGSSEGVTISAENRSNPTADTYKVKVDADESPETFSVFVKVDYLKLMPEDYTMTVTSRLLHLKNEKVQYWIAVDATE